VISCKEAVARLWAYLDRDLGGPQERELKDHLGLCRHCCGELEFARQVRERLRAPAAGVEISPETRQRVESFLERLSEKD
jgi:anti-sigma factor (TIGR02949 family)